MRTTLALLAIFAALSVARRLWNWIEAWLARVAPAAIDPGAPTRPPDRIRLARVGAAWKDAHAVAAVARPLLASGFQDIGSYWVREMPVTLRLLVHPEDALCAAIHEHRGARIWLELVTRYRNGTSVTFTTAEANGLDARPGHPIVSAPAASPLALLARARSERPGGALRPVVAEIAPGDFEQDHAESTDWRKRCGVPGTPVVGTAQPEAA